jgi:hypothetical protein
LGGSEMDDSMVPRHCPRQRNRPPDFLACASHQSSSFLHVPRGRGTGILTTTGVLSMAWAGLLWVQFDNCHDGRARQSVRVTERPIAGTGSIAGCFDGRQTTACTAREANPAAISPWPDCRSWGGGQPHPSRAGTRNCGSQCRPPWPRSFPSAGLFSIRCRRTRYSSIPFVGP